ncbi:unnamed protein product, partial [marine sediment metagenome]
IDRGKYKILRLEELTEEERFLVDPIVAPTSGLRIEILDKRERENSEKYVLTKGKLFLFLRVFKAISQKYKEMKDGKNLKVLIVTDNRPFTTCKKFSKFLHELNPNSCNFRVNCCFIVI